MQKFSLIMTALLLSAGAAHADLKVVQTTRIDNPQLKAYLETMTPQQRAQMANSGNPLLRGGPQITTVYVRGTKTRIDVGPTTYLIDSATHQTMTLNRATHTYTTQPYRVPSAAGQNVATIKNTGQTKIFVGHSAHRYLLTTTLASQPGTVIQGDIWAASDVPQPLLLSSGSGPFAMLQRLLQKIKGYPLKTTWAVTGSPLGNTTVQSSVISISKAPLPAALFAIPTGYKKVVPTEDGQ